jgi:hypothetical protein
LYFEISDIGTTEEYPADVARTRYVENEVNEHHELAGRTTQCPIVVDDEEEDEDEDDDTGRLSDLIALAEAGLQAKEDDDDTGRQSDLIALAEADLQRQAVEDEDAWFTQATEAAEAAEAAYIKRKAEQGNVGQASHTDEVVVEEWCFDDDELLTQYMTP